MDDLYESIARHRRALDDVTRLLSTVTADDLTRPSPCAGWDLSVLLAHMVGQNHGFAAAVSQGDAPVDVYRPRPLAAGRLQQQWRESADALAGALAAASPARGVRLAELNAEQAFPLPIVVAIQLLDTVVHGWDVARTIGLDHRPDDELVAAVGRIARLVPDGEPRREPGAAFAPAVALPAGDDWSRTLAHLGRRPGA